MSIHEEFVWRAALEQKGREWVARELRAKPGQPSDIVLDVVFQEPFPTREFCQRWCAAQENRMFSMSGNTMAVLVAIVVLASVTTMAVSSVKNHSPARNQYPDVGRAESAGSGQPPDLIQGTVPSVNGRSASGSSQSSLCAYATYQTAACRLH